MHKVWGSVNESHDNDLTIYIIEEKNGHIQTNNTHTHNREDKKWWYNHKEN